MNEKIVSAGGQRVRRALRISDLNREQLCDIAYAADELVTAGLCGDPTSEALSDLIDTLRLHGLADS